MPARATSMVVALCAAGAGGWLALNYPVEPTAVAAAFALLAALAWQFPLGWLLVLFALIPVIGFAPYTGWITFEETDMLALAAAAGGYARLALTRPAAPEQSRRSRSRGVSVLVWLLSLLFAGSILIALLRGIDDAGGFVFGWFQGYFEPMNSVRLAKSFFLALLLLPLWRAGEREAPEQASRWLTFGLAAGLITASLATVWERTAFTGLMNFSADYRTTALFWEMHVGGAALDGWLALTVPFAITALLAARQAPAFAFAAAALAIGGYACVTTFSRGVYLAAPIGAAITLALVWRAQRRSAPPGSTVRGDGHVMSAVVLVAGCALAVGWMFPGSGWRGMLAMLGTMAAWLALAPTLADARAKDWVSGLLLGIVLAALAVPAALFMPKGAYIVFAGAVAGVFALVASSMSGSQARARQPRGPSLLLACFVVVLTGVALVAWEWGGSAALLDAAPVLAGFIVLTIGTARFAQPAVPPSLRWQGSVMAAILLVAMAVGALGGGAYMSGRFSTGGRDLDDRFTHWRQGLAMLTTNADWLLGKGLGRFPASNYFSTASTDHPGDYRLVTQGANTFMRLSGGNHMMGWGELLRISQRVDVPGSATQVKVKVHTARDVLLHFEICQKQLLYNGSCVAGQYSVKAAPGEWQEVVAPLTGDSPDRGLWYAPAPLSFSIAVANPGDFAEVDDIRLLDAYGRNLLVNGDFSQDMAHWFFSSDRMHLPWHIKSMTMNVLFDQGAVGLALFALLFVGALWRVTLGNGRDHALAPATAGALVGFAVIGLFDSLLDVPRVALTFYFLLLLALVVRPRSSASAAGGEPAGSAGIGVATRSR